MKKEIIKEINVERLNICEPTGEIKLSLFNSKNVPSLIIGYEDLLPGHRSNDGISGAMFYNNEGDECGGFIYGSSVDDKGVPTIGMSLTFDQYKQDQVMQLSLQREGDTEMYGMTLFDRPNRTIKEDIETMNELRSTTDKELQKELGASLQKGHAKRLFVGKDVDGLIKLAMFDKTGKETINVYVDDEGNPKLLLHGKELDLTTLL